MLKSKLYFTPKEVAEILSISTHLLQKWRSLGIGLPFCKLGDGSNAPVRYTSRDIEIYMEARKIRTL